MRNMKSTKLLLGGLLFIIAVAMIIYGVFFLIPSQPTTSSTQISSTSLSTTKETIHSFPQLSTDIAENETAVDMVTSMGTIKIKLFPELAPKAVENFISLSKKGYYDGTIFHRVIQDFMIQGGDPEGTGTGGESIWREPFEVEPSDQLYHIRGALAMAKTNAPISIGSQFFIVQNQQDMSSSIADTVPNEIAEAYEKGGYPSLDGHYTVFGQVIHGMEVVDAIAALKTAKNDLPIEPVTVDSIVVHE